MFVIPCKYDPERPVIFECVASIRRHHPEALILVVDSDSPDTAYLERLKEEWNCWGIKAKNRNYGPGAFQLAMAVQNADFFYLFFDSLIVNDNLDDLQEHDLTTVRWFDSATTGWGWSEPEHHPLDQWARDRGVVIPERFKGVMGPMIAARREVIERADLFRILPTTRFEQCALERCWGIWLQEAGYDPAANSLQGEMHGFHDQHDESRVAKRSLSRA
jgi:hypothetical protein